MSIGCIGPADDGDRLIRFLQLPLIESAMSIR
jgi:hypothetical protein